MNMVLFFRGRKWFYEHILDDILKIIFQNFIISRYFGKKREKYLLVVGENRRKSILFMHGKAILKYSAFSDRKKQKNVVSIQSKVMRVADGAHREK
jgi:hypothetical protein